MQLPDEKEFEFRLRFELPSTRALVEIEAIADLLAHPKPKTSRYAWRSRDWPLEACGRR
jgi:hypothetical protein